MIGERAWSGTAAVMVLAGLEASCSGSSGISGSPCQMVCEKRNSCATTPDERLPCDAVCVYGGNYGPGLAPSPVCPALAAQTTCVQAAVAMSCDAYVDAVFACPLCGVLDGAPCASDRDCQKYQPAYLCDLSRPGGYCTAPARPPTTARWLGPRAACQAPRPASIPPRPAPRHGASSGAPRTPRAARAKGMPASA